MTDKAVKPIRVLTLTSLYPNAEKTRFGIFVETRLRQLIRHHGPECRVIAPVPWFPFRHSRFGDWSRFARIPSTEVRHEIPVRHPRFLVIPKLGMSLTPFTLALASIISIRKEYGKKPDFDLIDAHYYYPDGVAAALVGLYLKKPVVITARGSDINTISRFKLPNALIKWTLKRVQHSITVSEALREKLLEHGAEPGAVTTLRNGVDTDFFSPAEDRAALRKAMGIEGTLVLSVGNLVKLKGHDLVIAAVKDIPGVTLKIIGEGSERESLQRCIEESLQEGSVTLEGSKPPGQLRDYFRAADVLVLASESEGWANVLLESMACGTPVVATNVGGTPEVVASPEAGQLVERSVEAIRLGLLAHISTPLDRYKTRQYAEKFQWKPITDSIMAIFESCIQPNNHRLPQSAPVGGKGVKQ